MWSEEEKFIPTLFYSYLRPTKAETLYLIWGEKWNKTWFEILTFCIIDSLRNKYKVIPRGFSFLNVMKFSDDKHFLSNTVPKQISRQLITHIWDSCGENFLLLKNTALLLKALKKKNQTRASSTIKYCMADLLSWCKFFF